METSADKTKRRLIILGIIIFVIFWHNFGPVYKCKNVDKKSEWYVNDIYMSDQFYYNNILNEKEKQAYKVMFDNIKEMKKSFIVYVDMEGLDKVWDALICDHPEMINLSLFRYSSAGGGIEIYPTYLTTSKSKLRKMERKVQKEVGKVVSKASGKSDFEKEKIVYEYLGKNNAYGFTLKNTDQSAYTVFSFSNTVCAGYGKAAQILLSNCGVKSMININTDHLWNTVQLDGEYYYFDATCSGVFYRKLDGLYEHVSYMGLNQNEETSAYSLIYSDVVPKPHGTKYNYYDYMGLTLTYNGLDLSNIRKVLDESDYNVVEIKFTNYQEALAGLERHRRDLGLKSVYTYSGYCNGNHVIFLEKE